MQRLLLLPIEYNPIFNNTDSFQWSNFPNTPVILNSDEFLSYRLKDITKILESGQLTAATPIISTECELYSGFPYHDSIINKEIFHQNFLYSEEDDYVQILDSSASNIINIHCPDMGGYEEFFGYVPIAGLSSPQFCNLFFLDHSNKLLKILFLHNKHISLSYLPIDEKSKISNVYAKNNGIILKIKNQVTLKESAFWIAKKGKVSQLYHDCYFKQDFKSKTKFTFHHQMTKICGRDYKVSIYNKGQFQNIYFYLYQCIFKDDIQDFQESHLIASNFPISAGKWVEVIQKINGMEYPEKEKAQFIEL